MSPSNFCQTKHSSRFLSELMRPHPFVKLNAIEGLGGGAFTFSIFKVNKRSIEKVNAHLSS